MGKLILLLLTLCVLPTASWASIPEKVICADERQEWKVKFDLDGQTATNIAFTKKGKLKKAIPMVKGETHQKNNNTCYDFALGNSKFLNFDRSNGAKKFPAIFLISDNITARDKIVTCSVE